MKFGDREFYTDWWNAPSVGVYWRTWNKPVYQFMKRHVFSPLVGRGWSSGHASIAVFVFSAVLHELLVGIPTHNIIGTLPRINSDTESSRLTSCRCCFHWHDCPTSANCNYCAAGKDARHQWKDCRQLHLLGFVYPDRPTIGCIVVFFRLASEVWIGKQVDFKDDLARCTSLLSLTS